MFGTTHNGRVLWFVIPTYLELRAGTGDNENKLTVLMLGGLSHYDA